jgi:hypothetical protein
MKRWMLALVLIVGCRSGSDDAVTADADTGCAACGPDQICVQYMGYISGACPYGLGCEERHPMCTGNECSPDCDFWQCRNGQDAGGISCDVQPGCDNEVPGALHCYGP